MTKDKSSEGDDETPAAIKEAEAKEASLTTYFTSLKMAANIMLSSIKPREADRLATQSRRPMKDMPVDYLSAGAGKDPALVAGAASGGASGDTHTGGDEGDQGGAASTTTTAGGGEDSGSSGSGTTSSSGDTGGGPRMDPAPDSGYVSFADSMTATQQEAKASAKKVAPDISAFDREKSEQRQKGPDQVQKGATPEGAKAAVPQGPGPAAPGSGAKGGTPGGGPGGKGSPGGGPTVGP